MPISLPEADVCINSSPQITKVYCQDSSKMPSNVYFWNFYCLMLDDFNQIWSRAGWSNRVQSPCSTGLLGGQTICETNVKEQPTNQHPLLNSAAKLPNASLPVLDASIGNEHVLLLLNDWSVVAFGSNSRGQLGRSPDLVLTSTSQLTVSLDLFTATSQAAKIIAMDKSSFALSSTRTQIASWGCNLSGQLGRKPSTKPASDKESYIWSVGLVSLPGDQGEISDFECTYHTCYVLYGASGQVWSWGSAINMALGRKIASTAIYDDIPARANLVSGPYNGRLVKVTDIITSKTMSLVIMRAATSWPSPPVSSPSSCTIATPPPPGFICVGNTWISNSSINTPTLTVPGGSVHVVINGSLSTSTIIFGGLNSSLTINGCANNLTSVTIQVSDDDLKKFGSKEKLLQLISYASSNSSCRSLTTTQLSVSVIGKSCRSLKVTKVSSDGSLSGLFKLDSSRCNTWWIVLVSVLGGVIVLGVILVVLLAIFVPSVRKTIRPFSSRNRPEPGNVR